MKRTMLYLSATVLLAVISPCHGSAEDMTEAYIYKIENGSVFMAGSTGKQAGTDAREVKRMELLPDGAELLLQGNTAAYITCPGCNVVRITPKESPYKVDAGSLKKDESKSLKALSYLKSALKDFVYPDSKIGRRAFMHVRGVGEAETNDVCASVMPQDYEDILPMGKSVAFRWDMPGERFRIEIKNISSNQPVFQQETKEQSIKVPMSSFAQGYVYNWVVANEKKSVTCSSSFSVLSTGEAEKIEKNINAVLELLPKDVDEDTRLRVKAGYLLSEGFGYEAKKILYSK